MDARRVTVAVAPPGADAEGVADAAPVRQAVPVPAPVPDPDIPFEPLEPGELLAMVADGDPDAEAQFPERSRSELAAYRARHAAPAVAASVAPGLSPELSAARGRVDALAARVHELTELLSARAETGEPW